MGRNIKYGFLAGILFLVSCEYQAISPENYEAGQLYLPAAVNGVYLINESTKEPMTPNPTPGYAYRYILDRENNRFNIPLSVYRGGVNAGGNVSVNISVYADTIPQLIADEVLGDTVVLLPAGKYALENQVKFSQGSRTAPFTLAIDLDFLEANHPKMYVLPVKIGSDQQICNPALSTAIIAIDTQVIQNDIQ
ncbi:MAG: DUF1735 domain-containing protein [Dysgonamonadaceae bacterium]|jgi:hypothetical protein|nr:DUF1735 domain-containing protein [Dysgonamonadaceae bacterium]